MSPTLKVSLGPAETDSGVLRVVRLADGSGRGERWDSASRSWVPSDFVMDDILDFPELSAARAAELGIA